MTPGVYMIGRKDGACECFFVIATMSGRFIPPPHITHQQVTAARKSRRWWWRPMEIPDFIPSDEALEAMRHLRP